MQTFKTPKKKNKTFHLLSIHRNKILDNNLNKIENPNKDRYKMI